MRAILGLKNKAGPFESSIEAHVATSVIHSFVVNQVFRTTSHSNHVPLPIALTPSMGREAPFEQLRKEAQFKSKKDRINPSGRIN